MKTQYPRILASLVATSSIGILHAGIYTWNGSTTGGLGGSSNVWDTTTTNWTGAATTWPTTTTGDDDASFGGTGGTVTLESTVTANDVTFSVGSYTVGADSTAGILILDGTTPTITCSTGSLCSISAKIQGSSGLTKAGSTTLQLRGVNTYTGDTRVLRGNLLIGLSNNRLPIGTTLILGDPATNTSGVFQMNSRSQQVAGLTTAGSGTGNRVMNSSTSITTFTVNNSTDFTFGGILGGGTANDNNFNFTKSAAGRLILTGINTLTGTTTISGGTLELGNATNTLPNSSPVNVNGGTLDIADKTDTIGALTVTNGTITGSTGVLTAASCAGKAGTISAILAGSSNLSGTTTTWLTKDTVGTLELAAANTFTGNITVTAGRLTLSNSAAVGSVAGSDRKGIIVQGGGRSLGLKGGITLPAYLDIIASSNSGDGSGIENVSEDNEITGPVYFSTGLSALNISSTSGKLTISGDVSMTTTARTLYLGGASVADNTISGDISESTAAIMPLIKQGEGTWTLSGTNTYKGNTSVFSGTLVLASGGSTRLLPKADGSSNKFTGIGTLTLDGALDIDLTEATTADSWLLVDVENLNETYGTNFTVTGFAETAAESGIWEKSEGANLYTFTESTGVLTRSAATNNYASWLAANAPATGFDTDSDQDGVPNGVEHVLGSDPNSFSTGLSQVSSGNSSISYQHALNPNIASDVAYSYEWSTDLSQWLDSGTTNSAGITATITPSTPVSGVVAVTTSITAGSASKLFTRIRATQP
ncbi:MAG: hypothetical protein EAZ65_00525 [Verrucomicrobia bacterium]|nr:MAG: hypothetical protein EAZ84_12865 [Verrucomicrobiota bacterium]TAE89302.1 MAG: hypothetical protein EAZ82_01370 [Verrucomicrobiota bacterium]TAF27824.1 MAG: hypothetical protein EAZ71_00530 [Verrucomicrobiota bacterium]TAF42673.1 MAG: hypothetical protein EAZ65_00525 [Verrucomicrobiota bacterium]